MIVPPGKPTKEEIAILLRIVGYAEAGTLDQITQEEADVWRKFYVWFEEYVKAIEG